MTFYSVSNPFMQVLNLKGTGLNDGDVYFGVAGQDPVTNPKNVYWDLAGTDLAAQPIPTTGGYLFRNGSPAAVYIDDTYSIKVLDKNGAEIYYQANVFDPVFQIQEEMRHIAVASVEELEDVPDPAFGMVRYLNDGGRSGLFAFTNGNYAARVGVDALQGIYIASSTVPATTGVWVRDWAGVEAVPEWFGAIVNDVAFDCYPALQACLDVTNSLCLSQGTYYSSRGLLLAAFAVVKGQGEIHSGISCSHPTDHLMRQDGVPGVSYIGGANLSSFAISRSVNPTTPASPADDINQGHGLHFSMVSNPIVTDVYCYNNLVDIYLSNVLSPHTRNTRGLRQTGGAGDRWYGCYVNGVTGGGTFGGPSPNPSSTLFKPNMIAYNPVGQSWNYYFTGDLQDLWVVDAEAAGGDIQFYIDSDGGTAGDFHIVRPIADGYNNTGIYVYATPIGSSLNIKDAWVAPSAAATGPGYGVHLDAAHGVTLSVRGDFTAATGLTMVRMNDLSTANVFVRSNQCQYPVSTSGVIASTIDVIAFKNFSGAAFGEAVQLIGGSRNRVSAAGFCFGSQTWINMVGLDATASGYFIDVSGVAAATATALITISGVPITTQGDVSGHFIINPGAAAGSVSVGALTATTGNFSGAVTAPSFAAAGALSGASLAIGAGGITSSSGLTISSTSGGAIVDQFIIKNPAAASVGTGVGLRLVPNGASGVSRAAGLTSVQTISGDYANLALLVCNNTTPAAAVTFNVDRTADFAASVAVAGSVTATTTITTGSYTTATLPAVGASPRARAYVTDATAPTYGAALVGGGGVSTPVWCDGGNWRT